MQKDFDILQKQVEISPFLDPRNGLLSNSSFHSARRHLIEKNLILESNVRAGDSRERPYKISEGLTKQLHSVIPGYLEAVQKW